MCNRPGASARSWQRISHTPSCSRLRNNAGHEGSLGIPCTGAMALHSPPRRVATAPLRVTVKPEIFDLGWFVLQGYGLMIALGIVSACLVIPREARRLGLTGLHENFVEILVAMVTAAFLGGKLWFVLGDMPAARAIVERGGFAAILPEGFVFYGSLLACIPVLIAMLRHYDLPIAPSLDAMLLGTAPLHAFGRLGCFLGGCCHGCTTDVPWAVTFHSGQGLNGVPVHPTQLYEAAAEFLIFGYLWFRLRHRARFAGQVALTWLCLYAVVRFAMEMLRGDGNPVLIAWSETLHEAGNAPVGLTLSQATSLLILAVALPLLARGLRRTDA